MQGDGGVGAAEEAGGRARQDGRDGGTRKKAAVARSHLSWVTHLSDKKSDSPFRTPDSTAHFFSSMWLSLHSSGEGGRPCSCSARQAGDWFYWTSPFLKAFFFFLFPPLISRCQVILPVIQRRAETTFPPVYACNDASVGCKQSGWAEAAICRISLWSYQTVYHHFMSVFRQGKQLTIVVAKKQIIVSFLSKLIFIVSVTPDLFPGDFSFREFCSVKFGSSHCSRSGRLNISIWLIDLYGRAQNIERIALRRNAWNEDGRPGGIYLRRPALVCVPSERTMRLKKQSLP